MPFERLRVLGSSELALGRVTLAYLAEPHKEGLRAACAADPDIWARLYPYSMIGPQFDEWWGRSVSVPHRIVFAVIVDGAVAGTTGYLNIVPEPGVIEVGGTYIAPAFRGTRVNEAMKSIMLGNAFADGARRLELRIDATNARSRGATEKLGGKLDGILRAHSITWTGRVRDTCVYSILVDEWPGVRGRLDGLLKGRRASPRGYHRR